MVACLWQVYARQTLRPKPASLQHVQQINISYFCKKKFKYYVTTYLSWKSIPQFFHWKYHKNDIVLWFNENVRILFFLIFVSKKHLAHYTNKSIRVNTIVRMIAFKWIFNYYSYNKICKCSSSIKKKKKIKFFIL